MNELLYGLGKEQKTPPPQPKPLTKTPHFIMHAMKVSDETLIEHKKKSLNNSKSKTVVFTYEENGQRVYLYHNEQMTRWVSANCNMEANHTNKSLTVNGKKTTDSHFLTAFEQNVERCLRHPRRRQDV